MADYQSDVNKLPPGWDCKYDPVSGLYFYINYFTKTTTFEDPRIRYRAAAVPVPAPMPMPMPIQTQTGGYINSTESIPMQPLHGSPYHVYPANNYPTVQPAFQGPASGVPSISASPLLAAKLQQMEMSPVTRPQTPRTSTQRNNVQETSFITAADTEASVAKINTMFPTVPDTHIRMLLKKYYNREAVVISALQVEKHPLTTPGPFATPPPINRHFYNTASVLQMTPPLNRDISRTESPIPRPSSCASGSYGSPRFGETYRSSPKPHSSPKMKLRYLKSVFPKAEETLLLDILANADNNVQKASEQLVSMGYEKRDTTAPRLSMRKKDEDKNDIKKKIDKAIVAPPPKAKTLEDKNKMRQHLQAQYKDVPERIIAMALESVDYSEDKALQILQIVMQEDDKNNKGTTVKSEQEQIDGKVSSKPQSRSSSTTSKRDQHKSQHQQQQEQQELNNLALECGTTSSSFNTTAPQFHQQQQEQVQTAPVVMAGTTDDVLSPESVTKPRHQNRAKAKIEHTKASPGDEIMESAKKSDFKSLHQRTPVKGPNTELSKGPNDELLLLDYVTWNGANPDLTGGRKQVPHGNDSNLRSTERPYVARGSNNELCKGPKGLAKGSIYTQLGRLTADVKCN